jgi:hypothetical protein
MIFFIAPDLGLRSASIERATYFGSSANTPALSSSKTIVSFIVFKKRVCRSQQILRRRHSPTILA